MSARNTFSRNTAGAVLLTLSLTGMIRVAYADCSPDNAPATSGSIINCTGTTAGGIIAGASADNLTINIAAGATVQARTTPTPSVTILLGSGDLTDDDNHTSNVVTNNGTLVNAGGPQANNYVVNINGSHNTLINNGQVNLSITTADIIGRAAANTATARAIFSSSSSGEFEAIHIVNNGSISVQHGGTGAMAGFYPGEDIEDFVIDNHGTISATRTSTLTVSVNGSGALVASTPTVTTAATLSVGAAFDSDDDTEQYVIRNHASGVIEATGAYTAGIYSRAPGTLVINDGIIRNNSVTFDSVTGAMVNHEIAISSHQGLYAEQDDDAKVVTVTIGKTEIQNNGTIVGDIVMADANALRYWAREAKGLTGLVLNQTGRRDSEIENHAGGTITGDIYLGAGAHEIENAGTITGNIKVDQVALFTYPTAPSGYTLNYVMGGGDDDDDDDAPSSGSSTPPPDKHFTLENTGTLNGNITIKDVAGSVNRITLTGNGFSGNIAATTGAGNNALVLLGVGTLHNVAKFTTLDVGAAGAGGGDDDDDDDDDGPKPAATVWTLASGTTQEFLGIHAGDDDDRDGVIINSGASLIVDSTLKSDVTVASGGVLMGSGIIQGNVNNAGTINLRNTTLNVTGSVNLAAGSFLQTTITGNGAASANAASANTNAGLLKVGATGTADPSAKIVPVQATSGLVRSGDWYRVATNVNGGSVFDTLPSVQNSALISWTVQENDSQDLVIGATVRSVQSIPGISTAGASTLNALLGSNSDALSSLQGALQGLQTESQVRKAAEQLRPEANGGSSQLALTVNDRINSVIGQRVADTNLAAAYGTSGVSTGENDGSRAGWVQGFGFYGQQDQRNGVDGYTASTGGIAVGADTAIGAGNTTRVGIALSYASSEIDDDGVNDGNTTKVDSYQATLYGSYAMPTWYVNGALGLGLHKYDTLRIVTVGAVRDNATANHDGTQYSARVEGGLPMKLGNNMLVPVASLQYSHLDQEAYTESSTAGTALAVDKSRTDSIRSGLGAKMIFDMSEPDSRMAVELRAIWLHEFGDTSQDSTAKFAAGGTSFTTSGADIGRDSANLGIGMRFTSANGRQQVLVSYDAEIRDQYIGHTAMLQARQEF
ncbi:MAG TPA: autotransporter domain-containing protein [Burkholderiales bacterium]|nr:autotransporter domain-containing protein [Burkholderiales bacterium]